MFNVTDKNGKNFQFTLDQLQDINSNIYNPQPYKTSTEVDLTDHVVDITDEEGNVIGKVGDVSSITDSTGNLPKALKVSIETTHSGDNHNYAIYHSDSMENDGASFIHPYGKSLIKNHDTREEPLGRAKDIMFKQSDLCPDRDTILVDFMVNDKDAIEKFLDGRYKTVSIGGSVGHIKCNICGKDILKDKKFKFCGHFKGEKYGDNMALWHMRDIKYNECSIVNTPADDWAQVTKIVALGDDKPNDSKDDDNLQDGIEDNNIQDNVNPDIIDGLLNDDTNDNDNSNKDPQIDPDQEPENPINDENEDDTDYKALADELKTEIEGLNNSITAKDEVITTLENSIEAKDQEIDEITKKHDEYKKISIGLASNNKKLLVDMLMLMKNTTDSEKKEELLSMSVKDLNSLIDNFVPETKPVQVPQVTNPGIVSQNDNYSVNDDDTEDGKEETKSLDESTVLDSIINNIYK